MWNSVQDGPLKIHLEHHADGPRQPWVHAGGKVQGNDFALL